jgi:hypothetical protein
MGQQVVRSAPRARDATHLRSDHEVQNRALEPRPAEAAGHLPAGEGEEEVRGESRRQSASPPVPLFDRISREVHEGSNHRTLDGRARRTDIRRDLTPMSVLVNQGQSPGRRPAGLWVQSAGRARLDRAPQRDGAVRVADHRV